ncbi:MAG: hypothetical protein AAGG38_03180 [Planctomycetota bacterium]
MDQEFVVSFSSRRARSRQEADAQTPAGASTSYNAASPTGGGRSTASETRSSGAKIRIRLTRRWRWVWLATLIGGAAGAAAGWWAGGSPTYRAEGAARLGLTTETGDDAVLVMDQVAQRELKKLQELARSAAEPENPTRENKPAQTWRAEVGRDATAPTRLMVAAYAENLGVASEAVREILTEYAATSKLGDEAQSDTARAAAAAELTRWRAEAAEAAAALSALRTTTARGLTEPAGADTQPRDGDLEAAWAGAQWTQREAMRNLERLRRRLETLRTHPLPTLTQTAAVDLEAEAWQSQLQSIDDELVRVVWPPNPAVAARLRERAELERQLRERAADTRLLPLGEDGAALGGIRISELADQVRGLEGAAERAEGRVTALEPRVMALREKTAQAQRLAAEVAQREAALAELPVGVGVRLIGVDLPTPEGGEAGALWADTRPAWAAGLGGAGALAVAGLVVLGLLLDRRVRQGADGGLIGSAIPVLGAVPTVDGRDLSSTATAPGSGPSDGEDQVARNGVTSIQGVRAVLEGRIAAGGDKGGAFAVAGVASGSGATSVAVGLAASMALSGTRVLLIDLAWLQKPAGSGDDGEATRDGLGVDGVVQELGYLEDEDRELIALGDEEAGVGFGAMFGGASLRRSVVQTRIENLAVLSAMGRAAALRAEWSGRVSSRWLGRLMEVCQRGGYMATIVDAGSATGSVEGMLGCAAADGTVVVVSGDQTQVDYDKAVARLGLVGAEVIGTVLNRSTARRGRRRAEGTRSGHGTAGGARGAAGATTGSGIFAAAIEARAGGGGPGASSWPGSRSAPLPRIEDEPTGERRADAPAGASDVAPVSPPPGIAQGVDPVAEPPASVKPTPRRTPPAARSTAGTAGTMTPAVAEAINPAPASSGSPQPQVADDVMDQLVDHAIRAAERRRGSGPPAAPVSDPRTPPPPSTDGATLPGD